MDAPNYAVPFANRNAPGHPPWRGGVLAVKSQPQLFIAAENRWRHSLSRIEFPKYLQSVVFAAVVTLWIGCDHGLFPKKVSLSDPEIQPFLKAMEQVDRSSLGFTPVSTNAQISLELHPPGGAYDAMLHVHGATSRTIAFRKNESGYRWIFEQESYEGPGWYQSIDGTFRESMLVEYQTERVDGVPTNQLYIRYTGSDTNLIDREFTLDEARPILEKWNTTPVEPWPGYIDGARFRPSDVCVIHARCTRRMLRFSSDSGVDLPCYRCRFARCWHCLHCIACWCAAPQRLGGRSHFVHSDWCSRRDGRWRNCDVSMYLDCEGRLAFTLSLGGWRNDWSVSWSSVRVVIQQSVGAHRGRVDPQIGAEGKLKGPGAAAVCGRPQGPPGPCHFNKEQTPLGGLFDPNPRIHGGCFGV